MSTIKDVAQRAGVSIATVSAVINSTRSVSEPLKKRVLAAIDELDYRPNRLAQGLKRQKASTMAYLLPSVRNPFFSDLLSGVEKVATREDFSVIVCNVEGSERKTHKYADLLLGNQVGGLIITSPYTPAMAALAGSAIESDMPVVVLSGSRRLPGDQVKIDEEYGGRELARHLWDLKHRDFVFIGVRASGTSRKRFEAIQNYLRECGDDIHIDFVEARDYTEEAAYSQARLLVASHHSSTAWIAANDLMAAGVLKATEEIGLNIPGDVSLAAFDDTISSILRPRLTTLSPPKIQMGSLAAELLFDRLANADRDDREVVLRPSLKVRASTGPPPAAAASSESA